MSAGHLWDLPKGNGMAARYQGNQVAESPAVKVNEKQHVKERKKMTEKERMDKLVYEQKHNENKITNNGVYNQLEISKRKT